PSCVGCAGASPPSGLRRMLRWGDVRVSPGAGSEGLTAGQAARMLARAQATWGRQTYAAALGQLAEHHRDRAGDPELSQDARARHAERAAQTVCLQEWTAALLTLVPQPTPVPLGAGLRAAVTLVKSFARKSSELDGEATVALTEALGDLR